MRISLLAATPDPELRRSLKLTFANDVAVCPVWPASSLPEATDVLFIDLRALTSAAGDDLAHWSRDRCGPALILLDHPSVARETLARISADELLLPGVPFAAIVESIRAHTRTSVFRGAAAAVTSLSALPYPLNRFLAAALVGEHRRVSTLADACGFKQSTLRNQWRARRSDPTIRLEDVLRRVNDIRRRAADLPIGQLRSEIEEFVHDLVLASTPRRGGGVTEGANGFRGWRTLFAVVFSPWSCTLETVKRRRDWIIGTSQLGGVLMTRVLANLIAITTILLTAVVAFADEPKCDVEFCSYDFCWPWGDETTCEDIENGPQGCGHADTRCSDCTFVVEECMECSDGCNPQLGNCLGGECKAEVPHN